MLNIVDHTIFVVDGLHMTQIKYLKLKLTFSFFWLEIPAVFLSGVDIHVSKSENTLSDNRVSYMS